VIFPALTFLLLLSKVEGLSGKKVNTRLKEQMLLAKHFLYKKKNKRPAVTWYFFNNKKPKTISKNTIAVATTIIITQNKGRFVKWASLKKSAESGCHKGF